MQIAESERQKEERKVIAGYTSGRKAPEVNVYATVVVVLFCFVLFCVIYCTLM